VAPLVARYLRETRQKRADGSLITHLQLAESVWNPERGRGETHIVYGDSTSLHFEVDGEDHGGGPQDLVHGIATASHTVVDGLLFHCDGLPSLAVRAAGTAPQPPSRAQVRSRCD
jgi:hypothetical protein